MGEHEGHVALVPALLLPDEVPGVEPQGEPALPAGVLLPSKNIGVGRGRGWWRWTVSVVTVALMLPRRIARVPKIQVRTS